MAGKCVVGLDLSLTHSGICVLDGDERRILSCVPGKLRGMERIEHIIDAVREVVWDPYPGQQLPLVVIEGYSYGSKGRAVFDIAEMGGIVRWHLWHEMGAEYIECPPSTLKKWATGKGNADKGLMLATAIRKHGYEGSDHNEADALLLALWGREQ